MIFFSALCTLRDFVIDPKKCKKLGYVHNTKLMTFAVGPEHIYVYLKMKWLYLLIICIYQLSLSYTTRLILSFASA